MGVTTTTSIRAIRGSAGDGAGGRCSLCGEPNDCARAAATRADSGAAAGTEPRSAAEVPCWCFGRVFPGALLERATAVDGGAACVCRRCLAEAEKEAEKETETKTTTEVEAETEKG